jgi:hypothetical protein
LQQFGRACGTRVDKAKGGGHNKIASKYRTCARMAELADAPGSGPGSRKGVEVRVLFRAPVSFLGIHAENTGKQLWKFELPAGGRAAPMVSSLKGKQYLVISAGGHGKLGTKQGDNVVTFTLP